MTKVLVATGNQTGLPDQTALETFALADGGVGGYSAIVDPATPANALKPDAAGNLPVTNAALTSLDGKTPVLGQALAAASRPVVLPAAQVTAMTPPSNTGYALDGTDITTPFAMPAGGLGIRGWLSAIWTKLNGTLGVTGTFWQATQPVSIAAAVTIADGGGSITVDGSVSVSGVIAGTTATSLGKSEDAAAADGDTGVMALAVRKDVAATTVGADGDYAPLEVDANGRLHVALPPNAATESGHLATIDTSTARIPAQGQALAAASLPVVLTAIQQAALTPPAAITGFATAAKQPALGTAGAASTDVISVQGIAAGTPLAVGGTSKQVGVTMTRTADTNPYAANDAVNVSVTVPVLIQFAAMSRVASGTGYITKARLTTDQAACVAQMRLWLFSANSAFLSNDNAAQLIKYADRSIRLGFIDFPPLATEAGSDCAEAFDATLNFQFKADASSIVYGFLETKSAFTPASAQNFVITLDIDQN